MSNFFSIVMSTRNSVEWIDRSITSAITQNYKDFEVIFIDAQSTDGTFEKAKQFVDKFKDLIILQNETRKYQGENILIGTKMAKPKSIVITLDGDDWLKHSNVLTKLNSLYTDNVWMTYGSYEEYPYRDVSWNYDAYPNKVIQEKTFRQYSWLATHLRTFRRELFLKIKEEDLKDADGEFFKMAPDLSFQFPMLEMSQERSKFVKDILYVYNRANPLQETKVNQQLITDIEKRIRAKPKYERLVSL